MLPIQNMNGPYGLKSSRFPVRALPFLSSPRNLPIFAMCRDVADHVGLAPSVTATCGTSFLTPLFPNMVPDVHCPHTGVTGLEASRKSPESLQGTCNCQ